MIYKMAFITAFEDKFHILVDRKIFNIDYLAQWVSS